MIWDSVAESMAPYKEMRLSFSRMVMMTIKIKQSIGSNNMPLTTPNYKLFLHFHCMRAWAMPAFCRLFWAVAKEPRPQFTLSRTTDSVCELQPNQNRIPWILYIESRKTKNLCIQMMCSSFSSMQYIKTLEYTDNIRLDEYKYKSSQQWWPE